MTQVLIVDDNQANRYMLRALLQAHGFAVDEARDGAEALVRARQAPLDLIISDLLMPVMDGYTLLRHCRADERMKAIPFVVYTATYTEPKDERLAFALGVDAFVIKPAEPEPFMAQIRDVLAKAGRGELPSAAARPLDDVALLKDYNEVVVRKLEKRAQQLEALNGELRAEIAERRRTEAALKLRDRAIQAVSQGILITDPNQPDNPIVYASAGFERMTGHRPDAVLGRNARFMQGKDTDKETVRTLREAIAERRACAVEILNYRKDGTSFWNALSVNPVHDEEGAVAYFVGVQNDVTDRRKLEEQLRQAQKMEAVGRLAGGVAHDFNNLLTVILGSADHVLAIGGLDERTRKSVEAIGQAGERAAALTRQLLGFSRQTMLQPKALDLNAVVAETGKMLRRLIGEDIVFTTVLAPNLGRVKVDPGQLDQVLMNLAVNARDAMPGGGRLTIETANVLLSDDYAATHPDCKAGHHVMLAMTDTGSGMTREVLAHIFEPFFTTKEPGKGTGLGLPMVFGIVQQSGGHLHVYSEPNRGTTFKIYFPAVAEPAAGRANVAAKPGAQGTETILLVEDDDGVRELAVASLRARGYRVLAAADGNDALTRVQAHREPLDLVLTDVVMPNLSGPELAERLRARFPRIKVLFMSGYTDDAVVRHGVLQATASFIQKPYTPLGLAQKVREVLDAGAPGSA